MRVESAPPPVDGETLQALDRWENHWFPIADAALMRGFPAAHAALFLNLAQTTGPEAILSVQTFVDRIDALQSGASACGAEGAKAAKLLAKRGLNADVLREARDLLAALRKVAGPEQPFSADPRVELTTAEEAFWAWYLDWSKTARVAIKQRSLLRQLGFLQDRGGSEGEQAEDAPARGSARS